MFHTKTNIQNFYRHKTVFITGGTGLVGSFLIEKLLRSCPDVKKVYVLVREKRGKDVKQRLTELTSIPVYDVLKKNDSSQLLKLFVLKGDLEAAQLGLSDEDLETIINEVNCIFHVGATVRFTEELRRACLINVGGTKELLTIATKIKALKFFIHVSSAYSYCTRHVIDEVIYETKESAENLIQLVNSFSNEKLKKMTPIILADWPNTYLYTKAITEDLIRREGRGLPIAVVRPSIIYPTLQEPLPRLTTSSSSSNMFICSFNCGAAHILDSDPKNLVDIIPTDYVVNNIIAAGWDIGTTNCTKKSVQIYNCISSRQNPLTWYEYAEFLKKYDKIMPSTKKIWHQFIILSFNKILWLMLYWMQLPQVYSIDFFNLLLRKPQTAIKTFKNQHYVLSIARFVTEGKWIFENQNTQRLWNKLEQDDKQLFEFNAACINWDSMFFNTISGIRLHFLKESIETIPYAQSKRRRLKIVHFTLVYSTVLFILVIMLLLLRATVYKRVPISTNHLKGVVHAVIKWLIHNIIKQISNLTFFYIKFILINKVCIILSDHILPSSW